MWKSNYVTFWLKSYRVFQWHLNKNLTLPRKPYIKWLLLVFLTSSPATLPFVPMVCLHICSSISMTVSSCLWHLPTFLPLIKTVLSLVLCKLALFCPSNLSLNAISFERRFLSILSKGHYNISIHSLCSLILCIQSCLYVFVCLFVMVWFPYFTEKSLRAGIISVLFIIIKIRT